MDDAEFKCSDEEKKGVMTPFYIPHEGASLV